MNLAVLLLTFKKKKKSERLNKEQPVSALLLPRRAVRGKESGANLNPSSLGVKLYQVPPRQADAEEGCVIAVAAAGALRRRRRRALRRRRYQMPADSLSRS
jgi:hypothetical protein